MRRVGGKFLSGEQFFFLTIQRITGNFVPRFDCIYFGTEIAYLRVLVLSSLARVFSPSAPMTREGDDGGWMANECVSETCFDSGGNKGPLSPVWALLCPPGYICPSAPRDSVSEHPWRFSMERVETRETDERASGRAFFRDRLFKRASRRAFILFLFSFIYMYEHRA